MCQEEIAEEDLPVLMIAFMHQLNDSNITCKARRKTDYSHKKQYWQGEDKQNENN